MTGGAASDRSRAAKLPPRRDGTCSKRPIRDADWPCWFSAIALPLLRDCDTRPPEFRREILELGQPIPHRQHGFGVVDVHAGLEREPGNRGGKDIGQSERGV